MKRNLSVLLSLAAAVSLALPALAENKIAVVNLQKVGDGYWKMKQANAQLKARKADMDKARKGMMDDGQAALDEYNKLVQAASDQALSSEERDKRKASADKKLREINEIKQNLEQFDRTSITSLNEQQRRLQERILEEVKEVVGEKAKAEGCAVVLDTALLLYSSGENDMTEVVLKELNARKPVDLPDLDSKEPKKEEKKAE